MKHFAFLHKKSHIILIAIIVVFFGLLMISFSSPDIFGMIYIPEKLFTQNIYDFVLQNKVVCPWLEAPFPPLYYIFMGLYVIGIKFLHLVPSALFTLNKCPIWELTLNASILFWTKFPLLIFHFLSALLFTQFFSKQKFLWFLFWFLNPAIIFVSFAGGYFDIIGVFFILLSLWYARSHNLPLTALSIGIAGALKHHPFLLVLPMAIILGSSFKDRIRFILLSIIPYCIGAAFFLSPSLMHIFQFSENYRLFDLSFFIGQTKISIFFFFYFLILIRLVINQRKTFEDLVIACFLVFLVFLTTVFWFHNWFLYILPTALLLASRSKKINITLTLFYPIYFAYIIFLFPGIYDHGMLRPILKTFHPIILSLGWFSMDTVRQIILSSSLAIFVSLGYLSLHEPLKQDREVRLEDVFFPLLSFGGYLVVLLIFIFASGSNFF